MKAIFIALFAAALAAVATAAPLTEQQYQFLFTRFVDQYKKQYETSTFFNRYNVFRQNLNYVLAHNAKGEESFSVAMNEFGDLTVNEFKAKFLKLKDVNARFEEKNAPAHQLRASGIQVTDDVNFDWNNKGAVTRVKNQGQCGSCWAFSATGSIEGAHAIKTGDLVYVSEQQLVDCSGSFGNEGCNGGLMDSAFDWMLKNGGICAEKDYPYNARDNSCQKTCKPVVTISGYANVPTSEQGLMDAVNKVPVSVAIEAGQMAFQFYSGGVFTGQCGRNLDHGVLATGYGTDNGKQYWNVKNSWGTSWGESGYIRMVRNQNICGITDMSSYAIA